MQKANAEKTADATPMLYAQRALRTLSVVVGEQQMITADATKPIVPPGKKKTESMLLLSTSAMRRVSGQLRRARRRSLTPRSPSLRFIFSILC